MKYRTLQELVDAYADGTLSTESVLTIDNDDTTVYDQAGQLVFEMHPEELLEEALNLLQIPNEPV